jgi:tRNA(fMet)-specific endonuclease VapC
MIYLADANFLIYCWRNASHPDRLQSLRPLLESEIRLIWLVKAEFLRGAAMANHDPVRVRSFLAPHQTIWPDEETLTLYAQIYADLIRSNQMIGPHDLWIASAARQHNLPLLTRNTKEFRRVAGLQVVDYPVA